MPEESRLYFLKYITADIKSAATSMGKKFIDEMRKNCAELKINAQNKLGEVLSFIENKL
ncbi:MAG: hypothetical protein IH618_00855 [Ignavibacteriaceae bacterium]|nr:hypothetical protein [Ignavibacteriaceae bacterium]